MFALETNTDHSVVFEIASKYCISDSFVDYDGSSISSKGFLPTVVDIKIIELKSPIPVHFSLLITKILMFTLAISYLTTSNLPWFMELTFQVHMQYCSLQYQTLLPSPVTSTPGCCFHFSSISLFFLFSSSILGTYRPGDFIFQCHILLPLHTVHGFSRQEYWSGLPFPFKWTTFCQNSPPWPRLLGWPCTAWLIVSLSLTRLWSMWSDWLVSCDCGFQSVCPLMKKGKRLMEASWWERLTEEIGSCSDRRSQVQ